MNNERLLWGWMLAACVASRLLSAVYYIEDPDSLRFALGVVDYDVARLQPHFPAYPVFCFFVKTIYWICGSYALAFALTGAFATWAMVYCFFGLAGLDLRSGVGPALAALLFFNPLIWLMGNRYMPDLSGAACLMAALFLLGRDGAAWRREAGFFCAGLLAGTRLSYAPFVLPALLAGMERPGPRWRGVAAGAAGVAVWLVPLGWDTGWAELWAAGQRQGQGHFTDFGGTVATEPDWGRRAYGLAQGLWADGLGLYWEGRHWLTALSAACLGLALWGGRAGFGRPVRGGLPQAALWGAALYLLWVFFFQNVVYKSRHVLPLLPFVAWGLSLALTGAWWAGRGLRAMALLFVCLYAGIGSYLAWQHTQPTAIAQVQRYLRAHSEPRPRVVAAPLVVYTLQKQGVEADFVPVVPADAAALDSLARVPDLGITFAVGGSLPGLKPSATADFFHNPYVNRMWPALRVRQY